MATNWEEGLLPSAVAARVIESAIKESAVLQLAERQTMPTQTESVPVVSTAPSADFIATGARKPLATIEWSAEVLKAEELAAICAVPEAYISDTSGSWDVEASVENELGKAIGKRLDAAVLFGTNAPSSYPSGGIVGVAGTVLSGDDALTAIDAGLTAIESEGLTATGIVSSNVIGSALRQAYREAAALPGESPLASVYGVPVTLVVPWAPTTCNALIGDWGSYLLVGIREDVSYAVSREGTLLDDENNVVLSAFQDDQVICRIFARIGVAVARPVGADGTQAAPFKAVKWTT